MSDVRIVTVDELNVPECLHDVYEIIEDSPHGTHLLVPVENARKDKGTGFYFRWLHGVEDCPTCDGSGEKEYHREPDGPGFEDVERWKCPTCNGRGWVLAKGGEK
jgi:hypothetical protein